MFSDDDEQLGLTRRLEEFNGSHDNAVRRRNNVRLKEGLIDVSNLTVENKPRRLDDRLS